MSEDLTAPETGAETTVVVQPDADASQPSGEGQEAGAEGAEGEPAGEQQQPEGKGKERLQARFSELTGRIRTTEEERDYWKQQALTRPTEAEPEPEAQYGEDGDPVALTPAQLDALVERKFQEREQKATQQQAQNAHAQKAQGLQTKLYESGLEGAVLIASGAPIPFTEAMIDALSVSEQAAQVADHLGRNPGEAARIAALAPQMQGYELAKLEGRLASQPKTTNAPEPPSTVGVRGVAATGLRDDLPIDDWMRIEAERSAKRR